MSYFEDYKEREDRNADLQNLQNKKNKFLKTDELDSNDVPPEEEELKTLLETEKERRLKEMPKLRPAD